MPTLESFEVAFPAQFRVLAHWRQTFQNSPAAKLQRFVAARNSWVLEPASPVAAPFERNLFFVRPVGIWWPAKMFVECGEHVVCKCGHQVHFNSSSWCSTIREVLTEEDQWYMVYREYRCSKCKVQFTNISDHVLSQFPPTVRLMFGVKLHKKSAFDERFANSLMERYNGSKTEIKLLIGQIQRVRIARFEHVKSLYVAKWEISKEETTVGKDLTIPENPDDKKSAALRLASLELVDKAVFSLGLTKRESLKKNNITTVYQLATINTKECTDTQLRDLTGSKEKTKMKRLRTQLEKWQKNARRRLDEEIERDENIASFQQLKEILEKAEKEKHKLSANNAASTSNSSSSSSSSATKAPEPPNLESANDAQQHFPPLFNMTLQSMSLVHTSPAIPPEMPDFGEFEDEKKYAGKKITRGLIRSLCEESNEEVQALNVTEASRQSKATEVDEEIDDDDIEEDDDDDNVAGREEEEEEELEVMEIDAGNGTAVASLPPIQTDD